MLSEIVNRGRWWSWPTSGGPARSRLATFGGTALVGAAMVAISTLAPATPPSAAITALVVVFGIELASVFGGYVQGAVFPMLMAPVPAASLPAAPSAVPDRVLGWLLGNAVATVASLSIWPRDERDTLAFDSTGVLGRGTESTVSDGLRATETTAYSSSAPSAAGVVGLLARAPKRARSGRVWGWLDR